MGSSTFMGNMSIMRRKGICGTDVNGYSVLRGWGEALVNNIGQSALLLCLFVFMKWTWNQSAVSFLYEFICAI